MFSGLRSQYAQRENASVLTCNYDSVAQIVLISRDLRWRRPTFEKVTNAPLLDHIRVSLNAVTESWSADNLGDAKRDQMPRIRPHVTSCTYQAQLGRECQYRATSSALLNKF